MYSSPDRLMRESTLRAHSGLVRTHTWSGSLRKSTRWAWNQRADSKSCIRTPAQVGLASMEMRQASATPTTSCISPQLAR